jgi:hypothetical protein
LRNKQAAAKGGNSPGGSGAGDRSSVMQELVSQSPHQKAIQEQVHTMGAAVKQFGGQVTAFRTEVRPTLPQGVCVS